MLDLSFRVPKGSIYGVLARTGRGKSSTLRMLVACCGPRPGAFRALRSAYRATMKRVGYLPEERGLYRSMRAPRAAIAYLCETEGHPASKGLSSADQLLTDHGLGQVKRKKVRTLSKGMAQSSSARRHRPRARPHIFDDRSPARSGKSRVLARKTIRSQADAGAHSVLHPVMEHAERLCDRISAHR